MYHYYSYYIGKDGRNHLVADVVDDYETCKYLYDIHNKILDNEKGSNGNILDFRCQLVKCAY